MLELVRGYATAALDNAGRDGRTVAVASDLNSVSHLLVTSDPLRLALTDTAISATERAAVLEDLLSGKVAPEAASTLSFAIAYERPSDLSKTVEHLVEFAEVEAARVRSGAPVEPDSPIGRSGTFERVRGYAEREFEQLTSPDEVDEVEDEIFRFARIVEQARELRLLLSDYDAPLPRRLATLEDLIGGKVRPTTLWLVGYVLRAGRVRDLIGALEYLVDLAALERGRRVAEVRAVVDLSEAERARLAAALRRIVRRPVEIRVVIDPSVIGGIGIQVGDTVIDGTVRHRLERLKETLLQGA
jgi:F-type H+-transporting ATPase subunit delta